MDTEHEAHAGDTSADLDAQAGASANSGADAAASADPEADARENDAFLARQRRETRRSFIAKALGGTSLAVLGYYGLIDDGLTREARAQTLRDGRPRLPPNQRVIRRLRPMGGTPGDPSIENVRLRVIGDVDTPLELTFAQLLAMGVVTRTVDVHCVTGWSVLGARFEGVPLRVLADRAGVRSTARHVIFEAPYGYTANVPLREALAPNVLISHRLDGAPLERDHGGPLRAVVPSLYFWKSAKWVTGIRFTGRDAPGYWERRGYHNHGDPWREERYG
ncbi:MAG: molybdopterin-dependent oxidoreductase [Sandaracinaceae bacterium]|nr:molybdopterin-dependent oxidoreductase [Sandaracinaceae bacterium]